MPLEWEETDMTKHSDRRQFLKGSAAAGLGAVLTSYAGSARTSDPREGRAVPEWLILNADALKATVSRLPSTDEVEVSINVQLIVEFYSR